MNRTISLPDEILRKAEELAAHEQISIDDLIAAALAEQFASAEYVERRGRRARIHRFRAALDCIPDTEPEPYDRLS